MNIIEWGHSRMSLFERSGAFEDEDRMNFAGEFFFNVNGTVMLADQDIFNVVASDKDAHNPLIVHLTPFDMSHNEAKTSRSPEAKIAKSQRRKERQAENKKRGRDQEEDPQPPWREGCWQQHDRWHGRWSDPRTYQGASS